MTPALHGEHVERFRAFIATHLGLSFDETRQGVLADVFGRQLEREQLSSETYLARLESLSRAEMTALAQALTVAETYFFRNVEQLHAFAQVALPARQRLARDAGRRLQILSAGCATGEEPYSLSIAIRDALPDVRDVSILGVDINPVLLARARAGRYSSWALRETPPDVQRRWFRPDGRDFVLDETAREGVTFEVANLADAGAPLWQVEAYDVIFCRNVLIYLTPEATRSLVARLARALRPGGYLFLGHAETLRGISTSFHLQHTHDTFYYQRKEVLEREPAVSLPARVASDRRLAAVGVEIARDEAWVEVIQRASRRIATLTDTPAPLGPPPRLATEPAWDSRVALDLLRQERFTEALDVVEALPTARRDVETLLLHAVLLVHRGRFDNAERTCERLLELDELNAGAHYVLALCHEGAGAPARAVYHDQVATYLDPAFAMPRLHQGLMARRTGDKVAARRELGQALVLLQREEPARVLLFGGGFGRDALMTLCRHQLTACGGAG